MATTTNPETSPVTDPQTSPVTDPAAAPATAPIPNAEDKPGEAVGADQVQAKMDAETEKGYHGVRTDPTPHHHYTVQGVIAGLPTPETDRDAAEAVGSRRFDHLKTVEEN